MPLSLTGAGRVRLALKLFPKSKKDEVAGEHDGRLQMRLLAPAVDGKANASMVGLLSRLLGVKKTQVLLVTGEKARVKIVEIEGISLEQARERLGLSATE